MHNDEDKLVADQTTIYRLDINWLNAKIFDYIAANKRVFLVENDKGILEQILNEVGNSSYFCDTAIEVKDSLSDAEGSQGSPTFLRREKSATNTIPQKWNL